MNIRPDFIFSYWIFIWYILYILHFVQYNPKFALLFALIFNIIQIFVMIYYKNSWILIFLFSFVVFLIKGIPLWTLRSYPYEIKQIIYLIVLYTIYSLWLFINNTNPYIYIKNTYNRIKHNKPFGPFTSLYYLFRK